MKNNKGFTLIELVVVLSLLGIVLAGVLTFLGYFLGVFGDTKARTIVQDDVNNVLRILANDIRSATKPDLTYKSIVIYKANDESHKGDRIDIFDYKNNKYYLISYKYENNVLYRGITDAETADHIVKATVKYSVLLEGIIHPSESELFETDSEIFEDLTSDPKRDRRTIKINLIAKDKEGKIKKPVVISATYTSRSKGAP